MSDVSRRSFIELVSGALVSLPTLAGGFVLAPRPAYAAPDSTDESEAAGKESKYVIIDVVQPWEVGFMVVDITKGVEDESGIITYPPVKDASVTVTSRFNKATAKGVTDENGVANIDIRDLAVVEEGEDKNNLHSYYFNGSVVVTCSDYRTFETALLFVEGGTGLQVPAHPADDAGVAYPHLVSFDEWDALYGQNEFVVTSENSDDHTISVVVANVSQDQEVTYELWVDGEQSPRQSVKATIDPNYKVGVTYHSSFNPGTGGYVEHEDPIYATAAIASFTGPFLKKGDESVFSAGSKLKMVMTQGDISYSFPLAVSFYEGLSDAPADKQDQTLKPINTTGSGVELKWPQGIPLVGGGSLKIWTPELPIGVYFNPFGYIQITLKLPSWGFLDDAGSSDKNGWGKYPRKSVQAQWDKKVKTMQSMSDKANALVSEPGACQQIDFAAAISFFVSVQFVACAKWDSDKGLFQGMAGGQATLSFNFSLSENFFVGPIPVLITFALDMSATVGISAGAYASKNGADESMLDAVFDFSRWQWDYSNTGLSMTLNLTPSLSVGVGIRGVASISIKGAYTLSLYFGVPFVSTPGKPNPHKTAGWSAQILLVLDLFLFTKSFALYNKPYESFYDNWEGDGLKAGIPNAIPNPLANLSLGGVMGSLMPITNEMLTDTVEFRIDDSSPTNGQNREPGVWNPSTTQVEAPMEDGTPVTYTVFPLANENSNGESSTSVSYQPVGSHFTRTLPSPVVNALGAVGGVCPSSNIPIIVDEQGNPADVFGDPRVKVVDLFFNFERSGNPSKQDTKLHYKTTVTLRLGTVDVGGGQMRTRVIMTAIDGDNVGKSCVVEFSALDHAPLYDYSFDVYAVKVSRANGGMYIPTFDFSLLNIAIVCGSRDNDDDTPFASAATNLNFVMVTIPAGLFYGWSIDGRGDIEYYSEVSQSSTISPVGQQANQMYFPGSQAIGVRTEDYHCLSNLQVVNADNDSATLIPSSIVAFLDRVGSTADEALGENAELHLGLCIFDWTKGQVRRPDQSALDLGQADGTVYEMELYPSTADYFTLMMHGSQTSHYWRLKFNFYDNTLTEFVRCMDYDPTIRLVYWKGHDAFLVAYPTDGSQLNAPADQRDYSSWTLHQARWTDDPTPELQVDPIGPDNFTIVNFGVSPDGLYIFWPQSREADEDRVWDADGNEDVKERPAVYHIMACRTRGDHFSDPFIVADLPCDTDALEVFSTGRNAAVEMLRTEFVVSQDSDGKPKYLDNAGNPLYNASHIWYTSVPAVLCATATACEAPDPFVNPGGEIEFHVAVRNDGNMFLRGCTLTLCAYNEETDSYDRVDGASVELTFSKDTIRASNYNHDDGNGGLTDLEPDYALAPGKTSVYTVSVSVPSDWESGEKKVLFVASDGKQADEPSLAAQANGLEPVEFHIEPGEFKVVQSRTAPDAVQNSDRRHMDTLVVQQAVANGSFNSAPVTMTSGSGAGGQSTSGGSSAGGSTSGGAKSGGTAASSGTQPGVTAASGNTASRLSTTGDNTPSGLLGAGLAAAGAALLAYERRRARNERLEENVH